MAVGSQSGVVSEGLVRLLATARGEDGRRLWWPYRACALAFLHPGMSRPEWEWRCCGDAHGLSGGGAVAYLA
jgi:hypothetical protein